MLRKIVIIASILLVLIIAYNLLKQIIDAVRSGDRLSSQAESVYKLEAKNRQLKKKLSDIQSPQFIEEEARNKLGMGKPGETVIIIPEETLKLMLESSSSAQPVRLPNYIGWFRVFWH